MKSTLHNSLSRILVHSVWIIYPKRCFQIVITFKFHCCLNYKCSLIHYKRKEERMKNKSNWNLELVPLTLRFLFLSLHVFLPYLSHGMEIPSIWRHLLCQLLDQEKKVIWVLSHLCHHLLFSLQGNFFSFKPTKLMWKKIEASRYTIW